METLLRFAYYRILDLRVIAWLGIITYIMLFLTAILQTLKMKRKIKLPLKAHKTMAVISIILASFHGIMVMITYI